MCTVGQVCATLLGARHVPERLCGRACLQRGAITSVRPFTFNVGCLGGAAVRRRTRDRKVAGSTLVSAGAVSSQLGQLSRPSSRVGKSSTSLHGWG